MPHVRVEYQRGDTDAVMEWDGVQVAASSSAREPGSLRWAELSLWKLDGGGWLIHNIGRSRVYHRGDTLCRVGPNKDRIPGVPGRPSDLKPGAEPCYNCEPPYPERLERGEAIRVEIDNHKFTRCRTPLQVQQFLTKMRHGASGVTVVKTPRPVIELLAQAAEKEPGFARLPAVEERIEPVVTTARDHE